LLYQATGGLELPDAAAAHLTASDPEGIHADALANFLPFFSGPKLTNYYC
jgi:hypothetical protein